MTRYRVYVWCQGRVVDRKRTYQRLSTAELKARAALAVRGVSEVSVCREVDGELVERVRAWRPGVAV